MTRNRLSVLPGIVALIWLVLVPTAAAMPGDTTRVSVDGAGSEANGASSTSSISGDGTLVAFVSSASNLVPGDSNGVADIFVYDRGSGTVERVSVDNSGNQANASSTALAIGADGTTVAFASAASNLVPGDKNLRTDIFAYDLGSHTIERVSVDAGGTQANNNSSAPSISGDGNLVAFASGASNLVPGDVNALQDIFVYDLGTDTIERVSVDGAGVEADGASTNPSISGNGDVVAFNSSASNLVPGDNNGFADIFAYDRSGDTIERVNLSGSGAEALDPSPTNIAPAVSFDGRYVAFASFASNLVPGRVFGPQAYVRDRLAGATELASVDSSGSIRGDGTSSAPGISADGSTVAFTSTAPNLVPGDANRLSDVFVHERGGAAPVAPDVVTVDVADGEATPATQPILTPGVVDLNSTLETSWDAFLPGLEPQGLTPQMIDAVIHFDDDFSFDASGLPVCDPALLFGRTTAEAIDACPGSMVASGHVDAELGSGDVTFFNGAPAGVDPTVVVHVRIETADPPFTNVFSGAYGPSTLGGEYGTQLDFDFIAIGLAHLDLTFFGEPVPGVRYITARCADADRIWNFASNLSFAYGFYIQPQVISTTVDQPCQVGDSDGDGIADDVDTDPGTASEAFDDGEGMSGTIVDRADLDVTVADADSPGGVRVRTGPGAGQAALSTCGGFPVRVSADSEVVLTCGSVTVEVIQGEAEVVLGGGSIVVSIPEGGVAKVSDNGDGSFAVENLGGEPVAVTVDGVEQVVGAGDSTVVEALPSTTPGQVTGGGQVANATGNEKVAFGFTAKSDSKGLKGRCNLVDPSTKTKLDCDNVTAMTVNGSQAKIYGDAVIDGVATTYKITVDDLGEPGAGRDTFTIHTASGYQAGGVLKSGNIQVH